MSHERPHRDQSDPVTVNVDHLDKLTAPDQIARHQRQQRRGKRAGCRGPWFHVSHRERARVAPGCGFERSRGGWVRRGTAGRVRHQRPDNSIGVSRTPALRCALLSTSERPQLHSARLTFHGDSSAIAPECRRAEICDVLNDTCLVPSDS